jgi:hypothetical protein
MSISIAKQLLSSELHETSPEKLAFYAQLGYYIFHNANATLAPQFISTGFGINGSSEIGADGEKQVTRILEENFTIENVSKQGYAGDIMAKRDDIQILVEVKKYTKSVPQHEIDKFHRDIRANSNISGALFISLTSGIANMETMKFDTTGSIPIMFVCSEDRNIIKTAAEVVYAHAVSKQNMIKDQQALTQVSYQKIYKRITKINELMSGFSTTRELLNTARETILKQLNIIYQGIMTNELKIQEQLNGLRRHIVPMLANPNIIETTSDNLITQFETLCKKDYSLCLYILDKIQHQLINNIINKFIKLNPDESTPGETDFKINSDGKRITVNHGDRSISLGLLKTKSTISFGIEGATISIPSTAEYRDGMITFTIDKSTTKNGIGDILSYLATNQFQESLQACE